MWNDGGIFCHDDQHFVRTWQLAAHHAIGEGMDTARLTRRLMLMARAMEAWHVFMGFYWPNTEADTSEDDLSND